MGKDRNDDVVAARAANAANPMQVPQSLPEPAAAAIADGQAPAFVLPTNPITRFFLSHPPGFWFFFWGEFAERSSYYGMRAILTLYMADKLKLGEANAATYMAFFVAGCYFLPLLGGFIADRFFGKYWTIVGFSIPYILGHVILGVESYWFLVLALTLLAMGSGVIKPNISTLMGLTYDQQRPGQELLRSDAFAMFYFAINVGAALSQIAMPWIRTHYGYSIAFLFPAGLMVVSFAVFAAGKRYYAKETIGFRRKTPEELAAQWAILPRLLGLFVLVMFFWAIFDQSATTWIFFGKSFMDCRLFGVTVDPDSIQAFNPVFILIFLPLVQLLWKLLAHFHIRFRPTDKMIVGFLLTALTMGVMAGAAASAGVAPEKRPKLDDASKQIVKNGEVVMEYWTPDEKKVTVWWQVLAFLVLTIAEILISVTGLELAYAAAPKSMTGFVTACWLVTVGMANLFINAPVTQLYPTMPPVYYFSGLSGTLLIVTVLFFFVARQFNQAAAKAAAALLPETGVIQSQTRDGFQE
jgi:POT family proton-dependent oligopeptide transporter